LEPSDSSATSAPASNEQSSEIVSSEADGESSVSRNSLSDGGNTESQAELAAQKVSQCLDILELISSL